MEFINTIFPYISQFIICVLNFYNFNLFLRHFLRLKTKSLPSRIFKILIPAFVLCTVNLLNFNLLQNIPSLNLIFSYLCIFGLSLILYEGSLISKLLFSLLLETFASVAETLVISVAKMVLGEHFDTFLSTSGGLFAVTLLSQLLLFLLVEMAILIFRRKRYTHDTRLTVALYILPLISALALGIGGELALLTDSEVTQILILIESFGLVIANLAAFYVHDKLIERFDLQQRVQLMEETQNMQKEYYQSIEQQQEHANILMHDFKNYLTTLENIESIKHSETAQAYIRSVREKLNQNKMLDLGNQTLNAILYDKKCICESKHIQFTCSATCRGLEQMDSVDVCAIFANLLDNAITACEKVPEGNRYITLTLQRCRDTLFISVENAKNEPIRKAGSRILSTKTNPNRHGYGLISIQQAVEKYNGLFRVEYNDNSFLATISLPVLDEALSETNEAKIAESAKAEVVS